MTMTLERVRDGQLMEAVQQTKAGKPQKADACRAIADAIDAAIRERDRLRGEVDGLRDSLERAEAAQPRAAEPVAYGLFTKSGLIRMWSKKWFGECYGESCQPVPLYTHPQPARTFTDADIERAVRTHDSEDAAQKGEPDPWADEFPEPYRSERMTAMRLAIDAAMVKESGR